MLSFFATIFATDKALSATCAQKILEMLQRAEQQKVALDWNN
jgi:hypothetical protein